MLLLVVEVIFRLLEGECLLINVEEMVFEEESKFVMWAY